MTCARGFSRMLRRVLLKNWTGERHVRLVDEVDDRQYVVFGTPSFEQVLIATARHLRSTTRYREAAPGRTRVPSCSEARPGARTGRLIEDRLDEHADVR